MWIHLIISIFELADNDSSDYTHSSTIPPISPHLQDVKTQSTEKLNFEAEFHCFCQGLFLHDVESKISWREPWGCNPKSRSITTEIEQL